MLNDNSMMEPVERTQTGGDIFVSVEMSRLKWVVGLQAPWAEKGCLARNGMR